MNRQAYSTEEPIQQSTQQFDIDYAPALRMYLDTLENWRKQYEVLLTNAGAAGGNSAQNLMSPNVEKTWANWQHAGEDAFKRAVDQQIELCRFFGKRLALYRDLPEKLSRCKNPADFAQLQLDFINRMSTDYMQESATLARPVTEMVTNWTAGQGR